MLTIRVASRLAASPAAVWARVSTLEGVNEELWPVLRMTVPRGAAGDVLRTGDLGRSWLLLGGLLPVDFDDLHLVDVRPERGFSERSRLGSAQRWHHDRTLRPLPGGSCLLVDEVAFEPRVPVGGGLQAFLVEAIFRRRHRRLRRRFGTA